MPGPDPDGTVVDEIVAVVRSAAAKEPHVITATLVAEETRIALVSRGAVLAATEPLDRPALQSGLDWLIDQLLLFDDATRLQVFEVDPAHVQAELARFKARFPRRSEYEAFLARWDLPERSLESVLHRTVRVKRYVESRVSHAAHVPETEVTAWLERNGSALGVRDREAARAHLSESRVAQEVKVLLRDVRARAEIRILADLGSPVTTTNQDRGSRASPK